MRDASFASDNAAGAHPAVLEAIARANVGAALAYGNDPWTARAIEKVREAVGRADAAVFFVYAGTGANVLSLRALATRVESVLCADTAHLIGAETAAPQVVGGVQLLPVATARGKMTPEALRAALPARLGDHRPRPSVLSLTQATERGTVSTPSTSSARSWRPPTPWN